MRLNIDSETYIRQLQSSDAQQVFALVEQNREYLSQWLPWVDSTQSVDDSRAFLEMVERQHAEQNGLHCGITFEDQLVGLIGLRFTSGDFVANIGYWLSAQATGRGLMTQSTKCLCRYGFDQLGLERLEIRAATENKRSWSIPERLGFTREGVLRRVEKIADRYLDHYLYSLIRTDSVDWR